MGTFEAPDATGMHYRFTTATYRLYNESGDGTWMHHPDGFGVDVVGLLVQPSADWQNQAVNDASLKGLGDFSVTAGMDAFYSASRSIPRRRGPRCFRSGSGQRSRQSPLTSVARFLSTARRGRE